MTMDQLLAICICTPSPVPQCSSDILHSDHLSEHFLKDVLHFLHTAVTWYVRTEVAEPYGNSIYNLALFRISCVYNKQSLLNS